MQLYSFMMAALARRFNWPAFWNECDSMVVILIMPDAGCLDGGRRPERTKDLDPRELCDAVMVADGLYQVEPAP